MDMGRGTRLRRSPPGSNLGTPMYRADIGAMPFSGGFGGGGYGGRGGFSGNSSPTTAAAFGGSPFDMSPSATYADLQQQALLQSAALAMASQPLSRAASGALSLAQSVSGPLPDHITAAAAQPKRRSRSDAESEQAFAPFANTADDAGGLARLQPVSMGPTGGGGGAKLSVKGGSGRRSIDITVDASPQV